MRCPVVVGRDEELAALAEIFSRTAGGGGACVVVTGEAGVGKTRLVTEAVTWACAQGQVVLAGRSTPTDRVSPLRPLGEALLDGLRDRGPPDDPALTPYIPALGTLVPHWAADPAFPAVPPRRSCSPRRCCGFCAGCPSNAAPSSCWRTCIGQTAKRWPCWSTWPTMSRRSRDLTAAAGVLRRELAAAERAGLVLWRLRALNELGTVEVMRDARGDRLRRAYELAVRVGALDTAASTLINLAGLYVMTDVIPEALAAAGRARQLAAPLGAAQAVAAATAIEAVAHGLAGRRADMEQGLRRAVELAPDDADIAAYATGGTRGVVALLFEERAEALAAFARARELGAPIRAADPWHTALLVLAVQGDATVSEVEAELARATAGARWPAAWLGYAHAVTLAAAGGRTAAETAFGKAERAASRYPLFRAIALRLAAEAALEHPFGDPVTWLRDAEAAFVSRRLPRIASACRGLLARAGAPATRRRGRGDAALAPDLLRLGVTAREAEVLELVGERLPNKDHRRPAIPVAADRGKARRQPDAQDGRRRPGGARPAGPPALTTGIRMGAQHPCAAPAEPAPWQGQIHRDQGNAHDTHHARVYRHAARGNERAGDRACGPGLRPGPPGMERRH